jgi:hypothetical protein
LALKPPRSSKTARTGSRAATTVSDSGYVFSAICVIRPSASMNSMSSGT